MKSFLSDIHRAPVAEIEERMRRVYMPKTYTVSIRHSAPCMKPQEGVVLNLLKA